MISLGTAFANPISITATPEAGRYSGPQYIKLESSTPETKIWWTCQRNGHPSDLNAYSGAILLTMSCALTYFGYVTSELESSITRSDYTIVYPESLSMTALETDIQIQNTGDTTVDIGLWKVQGTTLSEIPAGTSIVPGGVYRLPLGEPGSTVTLSSLDGYEKSRVLVPLPPPVLPAVLRAPTAPSVTTPSTPAPELSLPTDPEIVEPPLPVLPTPSLPEVIPSPVIEPTPAPVNAGADLSDLKTSSLESKAPISPFILVILVLGILAGASFQIFQMRKESSAATLSPKKKSK